ncbi:hypothetical protein IKG05_01405 [Candidatus Saccharibacteria bacterium]|nr:hypothetical protein [Candidatus Saccharibacteria bacterium]
MKNHKIFLSTLIATLLVSSGLTLVISSANATNDNSQKLLAATNELAKNPLSQLGPKEESVYVITNPDGTANKTFVGSTLATTTEPLPLSLNIKYYLDGSEISATDLADKSGHVKITFDYIATKEYQNKLVPFLVITGLTLDNTKFNNITLNNGKVISENNNYTILGYSLAGLNYNLGIDLLPESFILEADVTNFELGNTYTFATNQILADLDTSKLNTIDDLVNSINQLSSGLDQIITGSTSLTNGIESLATGVKNLQIGAEALNAGANQLATGTAELSAGLTELTSYNASLINGAAQTFNGLLAQSNSAITANAELVTAITQYGIAFPLTIDNYATSLPAIINLLTIMKTQLEQQLPYITDPTEHAIVEAKIATLSTSITSLSTAQASYNNYNEFYTGLISYTDSVAQATSGANQLTTGANQLLAGTTELKTGVDTLASGANQLATGSQALNSGLQTFKSSGIDRLVNFANQDLANFTTNARATVNAAKSYHHYQNSSATSTKFIFKTPSIK